MNVTVLGHCCRRLWLLLNSVIDEVFYFDIWNVGIINKKVEKIEDLLQLDQWQLDSIWWFPSQPPLSYIADPFIYEYNSCRYLLVENYHYRGNGQIHKINLRRNDLEVCPDRFILESVITGDCHFSYPCIVTQAEQVYCVPEMHQKQRCQIYQLNREGNFVFEKILIDGIGVVDPTLFFANGYWWLFFTDIEQNSNLKLFAYYAEDLLGDWQPHQCNPLKCDVTCSRPAGKPFTVGNKLYRPAQDCSQTYGGAIMINEITELSPDSFGEILILKIRPNPSSPYPDGIHHLTIENDMIIIDAKKRTFDFFFKLKQLTPLLF